MHGAVTFLQKMLLPETGSISVFLLDGRSLVWSGWEPDGTIYRLSEGIPDLNENSIERPG
jgi:hypothetical protein